ncbi:MAG: nucleotidyltransferase family protein [Gammaproteobacteria bacterium]|nr:nucleotidyltransferase family protein [Gammaproteobacteria bacterium]
MKCMLLSAGLGKRMRPLTNQVPKPLIRLAGKSLIEHHLARLKTAGYKEVVINLSHLGDSIQKKLGDGGSYGIRIQYSHEGEHPLGTAGGIVHALPLLGERPFLVISSDIWCDHPLSFPDPVHENAHLILVNNPAHHPDGDFAYESGTACTTGNNFLTFSGIGVFKPELFKTQTGENQLAPVLRSAINQSQVTADHHTGAWFDIGTFERLFEAEQYLKNQTKNPTSSGKSPATSE